MNRKVGIVILVLCTLFLNIATKAEEKKSLEFGILQPEELISRDWEIIVKKEPLSKKYLPDILEACRRYENIYSIDPLLILALIKAESSFDNWCVSSVGAAGLLQIMPEVAQEDLGITSFLPSYFHQARSERKKANKYFESAIKSLKLGNIESASRHMRWMVRHEARAERLFGRYRKELESLVDGKTATELMDIDQRFIPQVAIHNGIKLFAELLRSRGGDVREATSAYNSGLSAVTKFRGIPFIRETVVFQNRVMNYYKRYRNLIAK